MSNPATIRLDDLQLVLAAERMRRNNAGRTCSLAAVTQTHMLECDCHSGRTPSPSWREQTLRTGPSRVTVGPIHRGFISRVIDRVSLCGGRRAVLRTWGTGVQALRAEPAYVLRGGQQ